MDYSFFNITLIFLTGFFAGNINVMAGGGSMLLMPLLIFLGIPPQMANGSIRIAVLVQSFVAIQNFKKQANFDFKKISKLGIWTIPGSLCGVFLAVSLPEEWFVRVLSLIIVLGAALLLFPQAKYTSDQTPQFPKNKFSTYLIMFFIGMYGGFIQIAIGIIFLIIFTRFFKSSLLNSNYYKVGIIAIYTLPALIFFIIAGQVDWKVGLLCAAGNATGAYTASKLAIKGGDKVIRAFVAIALTIMAIRLFY